MEIAIRSVRERGASASEHREAPFHLEAALAHVADAVITTDGAEIITYLNPSAAALLDCADAVGQPLTAVFRLAHADSSVAPESAVELAKNTESSARVMRHAVLIGDNGRPVVIEYGIGAIRGAAAAFAGVVIVFRDITHRRAAELALQTSEETLLANAEALFEEKERAQVTLNSIGDAVVSTDFRGRPAYLNIVAEKMSGWTQATMAQRTLDEIFLLVDSTTREHIPCPTMQAIIENRTVGLGADCVLIRRDGVEIAVQVSASPIHDKNGGVIGAVMVAHDVTVARDLSDKLARLALHDNLTDLPNRALFADRLSQSLVRAHRTGSSLALMFVDLDRFKAVNDSLGHATGDRLLQAVSRRLLNCVRSSDTVSRFGGDEFLILLTDVTHPEDAALCADKIIQAFDAPYEIGDHSLRVTASIGIANFPQDAADFETFLKHADVAMYQAKSAGRNKYRFFSRGMAGTAA